MMMIVIVLTVIIVFLTALKLYVTFSAGMCHCKNSMEGKVIIITGANSGIGYETALDLAKRNGRVILACRSKERGMKVANEIIHSTGNSNISVRQLDLSSLKSVRQFAADINATEDRLDVLIHNAGGSPNPGLHLTEDNLEEQFTTNHFGPFLLNHLLLDLLKKSAPSRIVIVSSVTHWWAMLDLDNLNCEKHVRHPYFIYCSTKLANLLFAHELSKRLKGTGVTVNSLHPGGVKTAIVRNLEWYYKYTIVLCIYPFLKDVKSGAQTTIHLAVADEVKTISGKYFADCKCAMIAPWARNDDKAKRLWEKCEIYTSIK